MLMEMIPQLTLFKKLMSAMLQGRQTPRALRSCPMLWLLWVSLNCQQSCPVNPETLVASYSKRKVWLHSTEEGMYHTSWKRQGSNFEHKTLRIPGGAHWPLHHSPRDPGASKLFNTSMTFSKSFEFFFFVLSFGKDHPVEKVRDEAASMIAVC